MLPLYLPVAHSIPSMKFSQRQYFLCPSCYSRVLDSSIYWDALVHNNKTPTNQRLQNQRVSVMLTDLNIRPLFDKYLGLKHDQQVVDGIMYLTYAAAGIVCCIIQLLSRHYPPAFLLKYDRILADVSYCFLGIIIIQYVVLQHVTRCAPFLHT
ncbi:uncharacterized protein EDB91DRAFT_190898 [Suillus paluster]|uniref:uncharacterized protein n=1 Tax=Suillus paluster TaxID=48578 RepID=UPI001B85D861|nr:uncharacterized protein EDB91DRAFT_190898 [Suillus paluster]KAG1744562.1 hypothetical protein EDB91DRAFT_190898 [Suillus paluster]